MSQYTWVSIDPSTESGSALATRLNAFVAAVQSRNKGSSAPASPVAGTRWIDDTANPWISKIYDGADWIIDGYYNTSTNVFTTAQANATTSVAGLLSSTDKTKLDGIAAGATNTQAVPTPVTLADGATVALDASLGDYFQLTTVNNAQILAPTSPTNGKAITIEITASGGTRTPTLASGTGGFVFGTDVTAVPAILSGKSIYIGCRYKASINKWRVVALTGGF